MCEKITVAQAKKYIDLIVSGSSTYLAAAIVGRERTSLRNAAARYYPNWKQCLPANHPVNTGVTEQGPRTKQLVKQQPPKQIKPKVVISNQKVIEFITHVESGESVEIAAQALGENKNHLLAAAKRYMPEFTMPAF